MTYVNEESDQRAARPELFSNSSVTSLSRPPVTADPPPQHSAVETAATNS
jgi:hypothetical protein